MINNNQLLIVFEKLTQDDRVQSAHVALFSALARIWQQAKFAPQFTINEFSLREASKIRSIRQYERCLKELDKWNYIRYFPSVQPGEEDIISLCDSSKSILQEEGKAPVGNTVVLPQVLTQATSPIFGAETDAGLQVGWEKLAQVIVQAIIQLLIAVINKQLDLF